MTALWIIGLVLVPAYLFIGYRFGDWCYKTWNRERWNWHKDSTLKAFFLFPVSALIGKSVCLAAAAFRGKTYRRLMSVAWPVKIALNIVLIACAWPWAIKKFLA